MSKRFLPLCWFFFWLGIIFTSCTGMPSQANVILLPVQKDSSDWSLPATWTPTPRLQPTYAPTKLAWPTAPMGRQPTLPPNGPLATPWEGMLGGTPWLPTMVAFESATMPPTWTPTPTFTASPTFTQTPFPTAFVPVEQVTVAPTLVLTLTPTPSPTLSPQPSPTVTPTARQVWVRPTPEDAKMIIGKTVLDRSLTVYRFGNGPVQRMVVAGIHGGYELNTIYLADELIAYFREYPETVPPMVTLYILRSLNPDGEARGQTPDGHNNAYGVDLNRNWDSKWRADWPKMGCYSASPVSAGEGPGSEAETKALMVFLGLRHISALVSFHSAAPGIYASGDPPHADSAALGRALSTASGYPYPGPPTGCLYSGSLVDWAHDALGIPAVDVELGDHFDTDFDQNLELVKALLWWTRP